MKVAFVMPGEPRFVDITAPSMRAMIDELSTEGVDVDVYIHAWNRCTNRYISKKASQEISWNPGDNRLLTSRTADSADVKNYVQKYWNLPDQNVLITDNSEVYDTFEDIINLDVAMSPITLYDSPIMTFFESIMSMSTHRQQSSSNYGLQGYFNPQAYHFRRERFNHVFGQLFSYKKAVDLLLQSEKTYDLVIRIRHDALPQKGRFWLTRELLESISEKLMQHETNYHERKVIDVGKPAGITTPDGSPIGKTDSGVLIFPQNPEFDAQRVGYYDIWSISYMHTALCLTQNLKQNLYNSVVYASSLHHYNTYLVNRAGMHYSWGLAAALAECQLVHFSYEDNIPNDIYQINDIVRSG